MAKKTDIDITYAPRPDATEAELDVLVSCYTFVLRCGEARRAEQDMKKGARPGAPDDGEESKNDPTAEPQYSR